MGLDLNNCDKSCFGCIKKYKKKHNLVKGDKFEVECKGIPQEYLSTDLSASLGPDEIDSALSMLDPVTWAAKTLDWHCFDPDGSIWKRKNPEEYRDWVQENPGKDIFGHSRYHRPYQAEMLRCTSKQKVARIGRQAGKTDALVISILFHMFTKPGVPENEGFKVILITPFQSQIEVVFNRIMQLLDSSPVTKNSLKRNVKAPIYTIELMNGSVVRGFTAGTKSGGNAGSVRGQTGHYLVFDEADYLAPGDIDSALSIITNHPNATVWMSSTPSGKREKFYQICNSKGWKEFHYSSKVNPMYSEKQDRLFRESLTEIGYKHEVLAEFGEQEEGVFQNVYVQAARREFGYGEYAYQNTWKYTVGVDWNDTKNGTTIAVLGFNPARNKFILVDRYIVSRDGWTQLAACQKIAEVNRLWHPFSIYLDAGHGGTQWEVLRKFGFDARIDPTRGAPHPDSKLPQILKKYDFGAKLETRDIFTGQPITKDAKPFLVESAIRRFEAQDIEIPFVDTSLEDQLLGYVIDRITPTGRPVYKAISEETGDHLLDAVMLSIVAFVLEATPIGKARYDNHIAFAGQFGEKIYDPKQDAGLVITSDPKRKVKKEQEGRSPDSRGLPTNEESLLKSAGDLPASHTNRGSGVGLWRWDGFMSDGPKPESPKKANNRRFRLRFGKPKRKNI